jgi:hypothetical protein
VDPTGPGSTPGCDHRHPVWSQGGPAVSVSSVSSVRTEPEGEAATEEEAGVGT